VSIQIFKITAATTIMSTSGFYSGDSTRNRILINNANNKDSNSLSNPTVSAKM
jgi:hypothetical protein